MPSDGAWRILLQVLSVSQSQLFSDQGTLRTVMQYHVIPQAAYTWQQLSQLPYLQPLDTSLPGQPVLIYSKPGEVNIAATSRCGGSAAVVLRVQGWFGQQHA